MTTKGATMMMSKAERGSPFGGPLWAYLTKAGVVFGLLHGEAQLVFRFFPQEKCGANFRNATWRVFP
jgi:hypothetical protein